jgi:pyruvate,water dikinase
MIYARDPSSGRRVETVDVPAAERNRFCLDDADVKELARQALATYREDFYVRRGQTPPAVP